MRANCEVNLPRIQEALQSSGEARFRCRLGPDIEGLTEGAIWEDIKADVKFDVFERATWKRTATVTDLDRVRHVMDLLGWIAPGQLTLFAPEQVLPPSRSARQRAWVAA